MMFSRVILVKLQSLSGPVRDRCKVKFGKLLRNPLALTALAIRSK